MSERTARVFMLLPWLSVPVVAAAHLLWWDSIPERLAVHFDWEGTPNGWMTREQSLVFDVVILLLVLVTSSFKLYRRGPAQAPGQLALFNVAVLFVTVVCLGILKYNVAGSLW